MTKQEPLPHTGIRDSRVGTHTLHKYLYFHIFVIHIFYLYFVRIYKISNHIEMEKKTNIRSE